MAFLFWTSLLDITIGPLGLDVWLMWFAVVVTLLSAGDYFSKFRGVLSRRDRT